MALLDQQARDEIGKLFEDLTAPVKLVFYTQRASPLLVPGQQDCASCEDEQQLLTEISELSEKLTLEIHDVKDEPDLASQAGIDKIPALVLEGPTERGAVRFFGLPSGYEFSTLIVDIVDVSNSNVVLAEKTVSALGELSEPVHIQVFVTPT
jgi:alkyl hydroperoxide reductase subunit AhpF